MWLVIQRKELAAAAAVVYQWDDDDVETSCDKKTTNIRENHEPTPKTQIVEKEKDLLEP